MITRYYITLGATTTAGGKVISGSHFDTINGAPLALEGDKCRCANCNSEGVIMLDGPRLSETINGLEVALNDDLCICKCSPPPRLIANQNFAYQNIDSDWHAAQASSAAETAAKLNTAGSSVATGSDATRLVLLDPETHEPLRQRPYRLELTDKMIEGTTDHNGATQPLTAKELASFIKWHVVSETARG